MIISEIMIKDALRYMQVPKEQLDEELIAKIKKTYHELWQMNTVKGTYKCVSIEVEPQIVFFENTHLKVISKDLSKLMAHCKKCYMLAVTLGQAVDRRIALKQKIDMLDAVILDACASVLIERFCDDLEQDIIKELHKEEFLTMRFSPGYGDVPLDIQQKLLDILEASKKIGLSVTKTNMLIPTKSITALIGVSNQKEDRMKSCRNCNLVKVCLYKERGDRCGL